MQKSSSSDPGIPAAELQPGRVVRAGVARPGVLRPSVVPAVLGKTVAEKIFEEFSWNPSDAVNKPPNCRSRMMD
jgi:hypothetical protein